METNTPIPVGLCQCGCGLQTPLAPMTSKRLGRIKGQPIKYIYGHQGRRPDLPLPRPPNPSGLCQCGCGKLTPIAKRNNYDQGHLKGHPISFIKGHHIKILDPGIRKQANADGTFTCTRCKIAKLPNQFYKRATSSNGIDSQCKDCERAVFSNWQKQNPERLIRKDQRHRLRLKYGLSLVEYDRLLAQQNHLCAICLRPERRLNRTGKPMSLSVDHDHVTGRIRGLLCKACNSAIGLFEDDGAIAERAALYLAD